MCGQSVLVVEVQSARLAKVVFLRRGLLMTPFRNWTFKVNVTTRVVELLMFYRVCPVTDQFASTLILKTAWNTVMMLDRVLDQVNFLGRGFVKVHVTSLAVSSLML